MPGLAPAGELLSFFKKESNQRKLSPLLTTLRFATGNLIPGFRPAHGRTPGAPKALWSNSYRESDVEVLSGTCRSKPPVEIPESGVIRRADSGAGRDTALCFARAWFHPHPNPLPPAGEGARPNSQGARSMEKCEQSSAATQARMSKNQSLISRPHISRSCEMNRHEQSDVP